LPRTRTTKTVAQRIDLNYFKRSTPFKRARLILVILTPLLAIGWMTGGEKGDGTLEFGGWIWRYDLAPLGPSQTAVTLTYDWSAVPQFIRERGIQFPPFGPEHLTNSLHHLAELAALSMSRVLKTCGQSWQGCVASWIQARLSGSSGVCDTVIAWIRKAT